MMTATLKPLLSNRISLVWLGLIAATVLSLLLGAEDVVSDAKLASVLVIVIAFVKVRFVGLYFMELRNAPTPLRLVFEGYCAVVCAGVTIMFLAGW